MSILDQRVGWSQIGGSTSIVPLWCRQLPPRGAPLAGIGKEQLKINTIAIATGGGVRVGIEDNIYLSKGVLAQSNKEFVVQAKSIAKSANRNIASIEQAKKILKIQN